MHIACQGTSGAFSHLAAKALFPEEPVSFFASFQETLNAVTDNKVDRAVIPVENSLAGRVMDIHNLLPKAGLYIVGEHFLRVEHHLQALPHASLKNIKTVMSHPQALAQCSQELFYLNVETKAMPNTALAAETVAKSSDISLAAIASEIASEKFGLKILKRNIEDSSENTTRFLALAKQPLPHPTTENTMTSLLFFIPNVPGALYNALGAFAHHGINLTRLESYIDCRKQGTAGFFVDIKANPTSLDYQNAFRELKKYSEKISVLGVYPACKNRSSDK